MCVGDKINYIYFCHGGYYQVMKVIITEINEDSIRIEDWGKCDMHSLDWYEGELYIWDRYYPRTETRVENMIKVLTSKETRRVDG
jgi:hypothetical protein